MRVQDALLAATVLAVPAAVEAQPFDGVYIGAGAGYNYRQGVDIRQSPALGTPNLKLSGSSGYVALGSLGYGFGNGLRIEVEGNWRNTQVRKITGTAFPTTSGGQVQNYGAMVNALFDMVVAAAPDEALYRSTLAAVLDRLTKTHGFALSADDRAQIEFIYRHAFFEEGRETLFEIPRHVLVPALVRRDRIRAGVADQAERVEHVLDNLSSGLLVVAGRPELGQVGLFERLAEQVERLVVAQIACEKREARRRLVGRGRKRHVPPGEPSLPIAATDTDMVFVFP